MLNECHLTNADPSWQQEGWQAAEACSAEAASSGCQLCPKLPLLSLTHSPQQSPLSSLSLALSPLSAKQAARRCSWLPPRMLWVLELVGAVDVLRTLFPEPARRGCCEPVVNCVCSSRADQMACRLLPEVDWCLSCNADNGERRTAWLPTGPTVLHVPQSIWLA